MIVTGERAVTSRNGFNPSWQRHVAGYALAAGFLGPGPVLDLGCGIGHSHELLAPRPTVGVDRDQSALVGQGRPTVCADMRDLPFASASFDSVVAAHSIEHVPDPELVAAEAARVTIPGGCCVFITPNRLTFGRPDEIIDPYHYVEFDPDELRALLAPRFASVRILGLVGSARYMAFHDEERRRLNRLLRRDPLRLRRLVPRRPRQRLYDWRLTRERARPDPVAATISVEDFRLDDADPARSLDLFAVCRVADAAVPRPVGVA